MCSDTNVLVLGAGMSGMAAALAADAVIYEKEVAAGGICSSYYVRPGTSQRLSSCPNDEEVYRFEIGGGHWIFGGDPAVLRALNSFTPLKSYARRSSVYFPGRNLYVPYPIQNHLKSLGTETASQVLEEIIHAPKARPTTMAQWLEQSFGRTLTELFFAPFHAFYTAGLWQQIAPQDSYKSPVDVALALRGAFQEVPAVGYNVTFAYPKKGLDALSQAMAARCKILYGREASRIDPVSREVLFSDGSSERYGTLISSLPLNRMMELTKLEIAAKPDPYTSVLVLNIGAVRGERCPDDHWLYNPENRSGFHRVGFYSNVDTSFLPASTRQPHSRTAIYVERSFPGGAKPSADAIDSYSESVQRELQEWGFIGDVEVADPTWIDVAYTWAWPGSNWRGEAMKALETHGIFPVGRYGRWCFQGIADSIRDGFIVGAAVKQGAMAALSRAMV